MRGCLGARIAIVRPAVSRHLGGLSGTPPCCSLARAVGWLCAGRLCRRRTPWVTVKVVGGENVGNMHRAERYRSLCSSDAAGLIMQCRCASMQVLVCASRSGRCVACRLYGSATRRLVVYVDRRLMLWQCHDDGRLDESASVLRDKLTRAAAMTPLTATQSI